ncbi:MAG: glycosyltransferase family 2 protein, partial [Halobacteriaceae archaeon]
SGGILASGAVQALGVLTVRIEIVSIVLVVGLLHAALSSIMVAVFVSLCGLVFGVKLARDHQSPTIQTDGDHVTAIVPVYEDAQVLDRCIQSLLNSCYDKLSVCIVCEPDDSASQRYAQSLATHDQIEVLVNTTNPGSKAGAINHAVDRTTSKYIAVFDADERVAPEFIGHAVANLDEYKIVQGRTVPEPTGAIEAVAYYESVLLSYVSRRVLYVLSEFRMASSRALVMHRTAFQEVGGYDAEMLTEDYAFAYRCYMDRVPVLETVAYPSRIKAAHTLRDWWGQRKRWMTGYVQVLHHLGSDLNPRDYRSVLSLVICAGTIIGNVLMLSSVDHIETV